MRRDPKRQKVMYRTTTTMMDRSAKPKATRSRNRIASRGNERQIAALKSAAERTGIPREERILGNGNHKRFGILFLSIISQRYNRARTRHQPCLARSFRLQIAFVLPSLVGVPARGLPAQGESRYVATGTTSTKEDFNDLSTSNLPQNLLGEEFLASALIGNISAYLQ
jgi:hypothetical protein